METSGGQISGAVTGQHRAGPRAANVEWEVVVGELHFPTSFTFGEDGTMYVAESGLPFGGAPPGGRIWRIEDERRELLAGDLRPPVNGITFHEGSLYATEAGHPSRTCVCTPRTEGRRPCWRACRDPATITQTWSPSAPTASSTSAREP